MYQGDVLISKHVLNFLPTNHQSLIQYIKLYCPRQQLLPTCGYLKQLKLSKILNSVPQLLSSYVWLVATTLDSTNIEHSYHHRSLLQSESEDQSIDHARSYGPLGTNKGGSDRGQQWRRRNGKAVCPSQSAFQVKEMVHTCMHTCICAHKQRWDSAAEEVIMWPQGLYE